MVGSPHADRDTVPGILADAARSAAERPALVLPEGALSFAELDARVRRFAALLADQGVRRGDRVALFLGNGQPFTVAHYAASTLGAVVVPVNPQLRGAVVRHALGVARPRCVVTSPALLPALAPMGEASARWILVEASPRPEDDLELRTGPSPEGAASRAPAALGDADARPPAAPVAPGDEAILFFTSGTTGTPKGILLTHAQALYGIDAWAARWSFDASTVSLMAAPFFHVVYNPLVLGAHRRHGAAVVQPDLGVRAVVHALERTRATAMMANPAFVMQLLSDRHVEGHDLSALHTLIFGAAPTPVPVVRALAERFPRCRLYNCYGLTETSSALTCLGGDEVAGREASVGRPHPGVELSVRDADGAAVAPGVQGEVCVRGPGVIDAYVAAPAVTAERFRGGWFRTGDVGRLDEEGYLYLLDRSDDLINVAGEKVYPCEIEAVLFEHPGVLDAAAIGAPHAKRGHVVVAFVVPKDGAALDAAALRRLCVDRLPPFAVPRRFEVLDRLPRNPTGKVLRRDLADAAGR